MVKRVREKYLLKAICKNGVSFFSVALIAATSIAIYLGIQSGAVTILERADRYFRENKLANAEITCANGITPEDVEALNEQEMVDAVEGGYKTMALMDDENEKIIVQVRSLLEKMNQTQIVEGQLPTGPDETAIEQKFADKQGLTVGDTITIGHDGELLHTDFTITAIINEPSFSCADVQDSRGKDEVGSGSASYYMEVPPEAFDASYYGDCYTVAYVRNERLSEMDFYSDDYESAESEWIGQLEEFGKDRAALRYDTLAETAGAYADAYGITFKDWVVSGRNSMGDVSGVEIIVEGLFTLSYSFALIFLLVAVVVCYAAVVKMIDDQKNLIGAQKALGFTTKEVFMHYMKYNILCALLGIFLGWVCSVIIVENLVLFVFKGEFLLGHIPVTFVWKEAVVVGLLCIVIFVAATFAGCSKVVRQPAVDLLRGEVPAQKKAYFFEAWKVYRKRNLYSRTMIKNVLSDKGRILTTIMGVVGCMALLIITFTLKFSISHATDRQFEDYFLYDNRLVVNTEEGDISKYGDVLDNEGISYRRIQDKLEYFRVDGGEWKSIHALTAEDETQLKDYIRLEDAKTGAEVSLPSDGILISRKCAENYDLEAGNEIELMDVEGNAKTCKVAGVIEHYLPYHQFVTTDSYYEEVMGKPADACVFLLKGDVSGLAKQFRDMDGFMSLRDNSEFANSFTSINLVIGICMAFSAILAVLVLLNQMNMYINRKARELAVMRINGYTIKETKNYISRDNVVIVVLGLLLGSLIGTPLAQLEVIIMETGMNRYIHTPSYPACFLSLIICSVFAYVINKIALRRIAHLSLTHVSSN